MAIMRGSGNPESELRQVTMGTAEPKMTATDSSVRKHPAKVGLLLQSSASQADVDGPRPGCTAGVPALKATSLEAAGVIFACSACSGVAMAVAARQRGHTSPRTRSPQFEQVISTMES